MDHGTEPPREHPADVPELPPAVPPFVPPAVPLAVPPAVLADLNPYDVDRLLRTYLEPPCFPDAVRRLAVGHLLVLAGAASTGKRLGAIALLSRMPLAEGSVAVLSPVATVVELAARMEFEPGRAYLLHDWAGDAGERHDLLKLADELTEVGCFLVLTRNGPPAPAVEVEHRWEAPASGELFELCVAGSGTTPRRSGHELAAARAYAATLSSPAAVVDLARQTVHLDTPMATLLARAGAGAGPGERGSEA
ncbi:hypothetical protein ACIBQX_41715 [Nonomuraea sp. NPDC049714]|uniref:hypothetical protein n=1 Tax=Nonomuraea sp. NPDC049714 TaxID=3364357 RepID=UPI003796C4FE